MTVFKEPFLWIADNCDYICSDLLPSEGRSCVFIIFLKTVIYFSSHIKIR